MLKRDLNFIYNVNPVYNEITIPVRLCVGL